MKLAIIHFSPLEQYPPVMNWLRFLETRLTGADRVIVFTRTAPREMETFETASPVLTIRRYPHSPGGSALSRYRGYIGFYTSTIRQLGRFRPDTVLYYESLSAIPAMYYKTLMQRKSRLLVHYHEYTSPQEYRSSMLINYRSHLLEKRLYPRFSGISHTNSTRLELFTRDNPGIALPAQTVWPNYPPGNWKTSAEKPRPGSPVRFVYVGALNLDTMFVRVFAEWIRAQNGRATWDIYSWNCTPATRRFLEAMQNSGIHFHEGVSYSDLPAILARFDIGVILYKGHIPNYVYNAPNKLFEYWSCGLDVWFPRQMTGALPYVSSGTFPQIMQVDFENLGAGQMAKTSRAGLRWSPSSFTSESAAEIFLSRMLQS